MSDPPASTLPQFPTDPDRTAAQPPDDATRSAELSAAAPAPGYDIRGELGRGGMGIVYHAVQTGLNRPVALKMVLAGGESPADRARFLAEAEAVAAVKHPHVVQVYEFGEHAGRPFFAMEYLPGGSLAARLKAGGPLPPHAAAALVRKIALGVQAAHDAGIVHRDLKPHNVLLDPAGEPKVSDFGLAKRAGGADLTRTGAVMGTPAYMAPEQAAGRTKFVGPAADVYALGVILYECLCGRVPFEADDPVTLIVKVAEDDPPPVRRFAPHVPKDLDRVCRKCLAKDPRERYATAAELAEDLEAVAAGEPPRHVRSSRYDQFLGALGRGRHAAEFARSAHFFVWLAGVMFATDLIVTLVLYRRLPGAVIPTVQFARILTVPALLYLSLRGRLLPETAGERMLWSVWGGYLAACMMTGISHRLEFGWDYYQEVRLYQTFALLAGLAFFALGAHFWGWCYAFGVGFLGLACLMAIDLRLAPVMFGTLWAAVLLAVSRHLRSLAALAAPPVAQPPRQPSG